MKFIAGNLFVVDFARRPTPTSKFDVFGIASGLDSPTFPVTALGLHFVWQGAVDDVSDLDVASGGVMLQICVVRPDGSLADIGQVHLEVKLDTGPIVFEYSSPLPPLLFNEPGMRLLQIRNGEEVVSTAPLMVRKATASGT